MANPTLWQNAIDSSFPKVHRPGMATIGTRDSLRILHEKTFGLFLDGGELGEILLPRREMPVKWAVGDFVDVFLYLDSEDRQVATEILDDNTLIERAKKSQDMKKSSFLKKNS